MDDMEQMPEKRPKAGRRADEGEKLPDGGGKRGGWDSGPSEDQLEAQQREQEKKFEERYFGEETETSATAAGMIPALDAPAEKELDTEDITKQVAEAPRNYNTQMQGLPDLEKDDTLHLPSSGEDIDISILHDVILPDNARDEEDVEVL